MNNLDKEINMLIMQEIGLEVGDRNRIFDQDTGLELKINGMDVTAPGYQERQAMEFDPYNNRKMMNQLFGYFLDKHSDETDIDVISYFDVPHDKDTSCVTCRMSDNSTITSNPYKRDSLKYTDLIIQLNGGEVEGLDKFDIMAINPSIKPRTVKSKTNRGKKNA